MKLMEKFADQVIASGTYEPLDRIYVLNKIRGFVGDEDVEAKDDESVVSQLVDLAVKRGKIDDGQTAKEILNDQTHKSVYQVPSTVLNAPPSKAGHWTNFQNHQTTHVPPLLLSLFALVIETTHER